MSKGSSANSLQDWRDWRPVWTKQLRSLGERSEINEVRREAPVNFQSIVAMLVGMWVTIVLAALLR